MANRRMFSLKIINSARFLRMPVDSQLLYFHLGLHADDDGVVEAYPVLKTIGSSEDNLRVLTAKGLVKVLNEDLVTYIMDWNEHNAIRADRKVDSVYKNLLLQLLPEVEVVDAKPRADTNKLTGRPMDNQRTAQVRLGKVRIGEEKEASSSNVATPAQVTSAFFSSVITKNLPDDVKEMLASVAEKMGISKEVVWSEVQKFTLYWTEKTKSGKKERWETEKTFEAKKRLFTWLQRSQSNTFKGLPVRDKNNVQVV